MARKGLAGQMSMFDFWNEGDGEVEMVSLVPSAGEEVVTSHRTEVDAFSRNVNTDAEHEDVAIKKTVADHAISVIHHAERPVSVKTRPVKSINPSKPEDGKSDIGKTENGRQNLTQDEKSEMIGQIALEKSTSEFPEDYDIKIATKESIRAPKHRSDDGQQAVMHAEKKDSSGKLLAEISYLNYNKVFLRREGAQGELYQFDNSKDAVEFYIREMSKLGCCEE